MSTTTTVQANQVKPRDLVVFMDQAKVDSVSHLREFHVTFRFAGRPRLELSIHKDSWVTVVRKRSK